MLGEDHLRHALLVGLLAEVVLVAVDEEDEVGILLEAARLAEIGEDRPLVVSLLDRTRELREREDRDVEVACKDLQATSAAVLSNAPP